MIDSNTPSAEGRDPPHEIFMCVQEDGVGVTRRVPLSDRFPWIRRTFCTLTSGRETAGKSERERAREEKERERERARGEKTGEVGGWR